MLGLTRLLHFLMGQGIAEGSSLIVQDLLQVDQYRNNRGVHATSLGVVAQRIRIDSRVGLNIYAGAREGNNTTVPATEIMELLRGSNLRETPADIAMNPAEALIFFNIKLSDLVRHNRASARDLFMRIRAFVNALWCLMKTWRRTSLPNGAPVSQARTLSNNIFLSPLSEVSSKPESRINDFSFIE